jgi:hypothetical protein
MGTTAHPDRGGAIQDKYKLKEKGGSRPISRVLSWTVIHLVNMSPCDSSNLPGNLYGPHQCSPIWSCSEWGLPCHCCYQQRGALLPHHFNLTGIPKQIGVLRRYIFCCTFRRLAPPRRYLALCPMEPGLSSAPTSEKGMPRLSSRLPAASLRKRSRADKRVHPTLLRKLHIYPLKIYTHPWTTHPCQTRRQHP